MLDPCTTTTTTPRPALKSVNTYHTLSKHKKETGHYLRNGKKRKSSGDHQVSKRIKKTIISCLEESGGEEKEQLSDAEGEGDVDDDDGDTTEETDEDVDDDDGDSCRKETDEDVDDDDGDIRKETD